MTAFLHIVYDKKPESCCRRKGGTRISKCTMWAWLLIFKIFRMKKTVQKDLEVASDPSLRSQQDGLVDEGACYEGWELVQPWATGQRSKAAPTGCAPPSMCTHTKCMS